MFSHEKSKDKEMIRLDVSRIQDVMSTPDGFMNLDGFIWTHPGENVAASQQECDGRDGENIPQDIYWIHNRFAECIICVDVFLDA